MDNTVFIYKVDNYYNPASERGIAYDDKNLAIDWMLKSTELKLSEKDSKLPLFKNADYYESL